ncbi:MAG: hypothetical protein ACOC0X_03955 [Halobacteriota archaeon]
MSADAPGVVELDLAGSILDERTLDRLDPVIDVEVRDLGDGRYRVEECRVDLDRLLQALGLYRSIAEFRYDWR